MRGLALARRRIVLHQIRRATPQSIRQRLGYASASSVGADEKTFEALAKDPKYLCAAVQKLKPEVVPSWGMGNFFAIKSV